MDLKYTIKESDFKSLGYKFQELYASNYKTYRKNVECWDILCWVKGKNVEVDDWYNNTKNIINFFINNYDQWEIENNKLPRALNYFHIYKHKNTDELKMRNNSDYYSQYDSNEKQDAYLESMKDYREISIPLECIGGLIKEINKITNNEFLWKKKQKVNM